MEKAISQKTTFFSSFSSFKIWIHNPALNNSLKVAIGCCFGTDIFIAGLSYKKVPVPLPATGIKFK
jgi:hypothetical protein